MVIWRVELGLCSPVRHSSWLCVMKSAHVAGQSARKTQSEYKRLHISPFGDSSRLFGRFNIPCLTVFDSSNSNVTLCAEPRGHIWLQHGIWPVRHLEPPSPCLTDISTERKVWTSFPDLPSSLEGYFLSPFAIIIRFLLRNGSDAEVTLNILMAAAQGCWADFCRFHGMTDHSGLKEYFCSHWQMS